VGPCPYDCELCTDHEQHSAFRLWEVTDYTICVPGMLRGGAAAQSAQNIDALAMIEKECWTMVVRKGGIPTWCNSSGPGPGETTRHPDFFTIVKMAKARPIRHLMVNTMESDSPRMTIFVIKRLRRNRGDFARLPAFDSFEREGAMIDLSGGDLRSRFASAPSSSLLNKI